MSCLAFQFRVQDRHKTTKLVGSLSYEIKPISTWAPTAFGILISGLPKEIH
jgi:hypothetical protein